MKRVLHVGCGKSRILQRHKHFQAAAWEEVRLDIDKAAKPDIVADITDMNVVPSASFDAVFSSHNLEHVYRHQVPVVLREFRRVLKGDGIALITVPELQAVGQYIVEGKHEEALCESPAGPVAPLDVLYGF